MVISAENVIILRRPDTQSVGQLVLFYACHSVVVLRTLVLSGTDTTSLECCRAWCTFSELTRIHPKQHSTVFFLFLINHISGSGKQQSQRELMYANLDGWLVDIVTCVPACVQKDKELWHNNGVSACRIQCRVQ